LSQGYITEEIGKVTLNQPEVVTLLSPIRDAQYLKSLQNPTSTAPDAGLGVIDNPFFFVAGHYPGGLSPTGAPEDRTYLLWFGSPAGTTNEKPQFSVFYAKVHPERYVPNAPASTWLDPPVLLVSYDQISSDVVNWFDSNYPAGASNGVGNSFTSTTPGVIQNPYNSNVYFLCNSTYGCIFPSSSTNSSTPTVNPGNVSGTPELKQLHLVYDPLDDTVLMYFSIITPNWNTNTKSIYVYKFPVSLLKNNQSINQYAVSGLTPTTTSTPPPNDKLYFLGGLTLDSVFNQSFTEYWTTPLAIPVGATFSAPQFTIAFDYMKLTAPWGYLLSKGYLPALLVAVEGYMAVSSSYVSGTNAPHGDGILVALLQDIHANPAQPTVFRMPNYGNAYTNAPTGYTPAFTHFPALDIHEQGVVIDKFGSILPMQSEGNLSGYVVPFTTPARPDIKLASMRMRLLFLEPATWLNMFPDTGQSYPWFVASATKSVIDPIYPLMGLCRPYVTLLPDGKPKVVLGGFYYDEYLEGVAVYFDPNVLKPSYHRELIGLAGNIPLTVSSPTSSFTLATGPSGMNARLFGSFGKKYARIVPGQGGVSNTFIVISLNYFTGYPNLPFAFNSYRDGMNFYPSPQYVMQGVVVNQQGSTYSNSYIISTPPIKVGRFFDVIYMAWKPIAAILTDEGEGDE